MSVVLEFTIGPTDFELGRVLLGQEAERIELERIVPAGDAIMPFFWVQGGNETVLETKVEDSDYIENLVLVDRVNDYRLYRAEWVGEYEDLVAGIVTNQGTILEAYGGGEWYFQVRFLDHQHVGEFYNFCSGSDLEIHVERVYSLTEESLQGRIFDLTPEQREALVLAVQEGYFDTPRRTSMEALGEALGISQQAFSARLRAGNRKVLESVLFADVR